MTRHQDERFEGRRGQDRRGLSQGEGRDPGRGESERRATTDARRYIDDPRMDDRRYVDRGYVDDPRMGEPRYMDDRRSEDRHYIDDRRFDDRHYVDDRRYLDDRRFDDERYEDEPWASRERDEIEPEYEWSGRRFSSGAPRYTGQRGNRQPQTGRGDYSQGGSWEAEASRHSRGGFGRDRFYGQEGYAESDYRRTGSGSGWGQGDRGAFGHREPGSGGYGTGPERDWGRWRERFGESMYESGWGGPHAGRGPKGYQRSDERIKEDVCERLTQHGDIDASDIEVKVTNREITLTGTVSSRQAKRLAEDLAEAVPGVTEVHNQLRVSREQQPAQQASAPAGAKGGRDGQQPVRAA